MYVHICNYIYDRFSPCTCYDIYQLQPPMLKNTAKVSVPHRCQTHPQGATLGSPEKPDFITSGWIIPSGKRLQKTDGKITMRFSWIFMGKSTISTGLCSIAMLNYQRVIFHEPEMLGHFGMIPLINHDSRLRSQWVRYNLPRSHSFIVWKNTKQEKLEVYTKLRNLETLRRIRISSNSHPGNGISIVLRIAILARCSHYALC